ncbi:MAG: hypothetical protein HRU16_11125 [Planctomycetes bacterium]|nr:hypothetical protein [Planctomycetota bacterium]
MRIIDLDELAATPIVEYQSTAAASVSIAQGRGDGHIHWLRFEPGGVIGSHPAGPAQLFIPIEGSGWAAGSDAVRRSIARGQAAFIASGEIHSKGSEVGMNALIIQLSTLDLTSDEQAAG